MDDFADRLRERVSRSLANNYSDNYDHIRFGAEPRVALTRRAKDLLKRLLLQTFPAFRDRELSFLAPAIDKHTACFADLHSLLEDDESRRLLLDVAAYRIMGHRKIRLPHSTPAYWRILKRIDEMKDSSEVIDPQFLHVLLHRFNLEELGFPIRLFFTSLGVLTDFWIEQYRLRRKELVVVGAFPGDVVIDGGGCWGDSALYFSSLVGAEGKVYSFEFIPSNIAIFNQNLDLNPVLKNNVVLVQHALWTHSKMPLYYSDAGPASRVSVNRSAAFDGATETLSIDDLADRTREGRIDFIKLDIEGAELPALQGAERTLRKFKPKLAVALYHQLRDFKDIPHFIQSLNLGYKFYFSHCTIQHEESVLFASSEAT